jgi:hypothetical protein
MQLEIDLVEKYQPEMNKPRKISPTVRVDYATLMWIMESNAKKKSFFPRRPLP